jgi:hypothetical protein
VGSKWSFVNKQSPVVYLCCNADEGEPGTFKDRWILEHSPHQLVEGILLAAFALHARHAFVYIRGEFDLPLRRLRGALQEARAAGLVGEGILGSAFACDIVVHRGGGAYVCGEESSLINSLEGKKGYPRNKPPFPAVKGFYGAPTVVNNVETLANVPGSSRAEARPTPHSASKANPGPSPVRAFRTRQQARALRAADRLFVEEAHLRGRRRQSSAARRSRPSFPAEARRRCSRPAKSRPSRSTRRRCSRPAACWAPAASSSSPKARAWCACCRC